MAGWWWVNGTINVQTEAWSVLIKKHDEMTKDTHLGKGKRKSSSGGTAEAVPKSKIAPKSNGWTSATETGGSTIAVTEDGMGGGLAVDAPPDARGHCPCPRRKTTWPVSFEHRTQRGAARVDI